MASFGALEIALETPDQPSVRAMLEASDAYMARLYPPQSNHLLDVASLLATNVRFCVARLGGNGVGRKILRVLEQIALAERRRTLRLELGSAQPAAYRLYRSAGFEEIAAYGAYEPDPLSLFMEKRLAASG